MICGDLYYKCLQEAEREAAVPSRLPLWHGILPSAVPPGMVATQLPTLPPHLWPHNYIYLTVAVTAILGLLNVLILPFTIPAIVLSGIVSTAYSKVADLIICSFLVDVYSEQEW